MDGVQHLAATLAPDSCMIGIQLIPMILAYTFLLEESVGSLLSKLVRRAGKAQSWNREFYIRRDRAADTSAI